MAGPAASDEIIRARSFQWREPRQRESAREVLIERLGLGSRCRFGPARVGVLLILLPYGRRDRIANSGEARDCIPDAGLLARLGNLLRQCRLDGGGPVSTEQAVRGGKSVQRLVARQDAERVRFYGFSR